MKTGSVLSPFCFLRALVAAAWLFGSAGWLSTAWAQAEISTGREAVFVGHYDGGSGGFLWLHEANQLIGTDALYGMGYWGVGSRIASVEGGLAWEGHEVFRQRQEGVPVSLGPGITIIYTPGTFNQNSSIPYEAESAPSAGQASGHATAVAAMLGGLTLGDAGELLVLGTGIAPLAELQSGGIAVSFDTENPGNFSFTKTSFLKPYVDYFTGTGTATAKMDVINSSWGYADPSGREWIYTGLLDGLANENAEVTLVTAAGNSGAGTAPASPAGGFNGISVGAVTQDGVRTERYLHPAEFTPDQRLDFYNPQTGVTVTGARAGVHLVAPGTDMILAAYDETQPEADDLYFINAAGTSFAAPMVAGGVALLKELARDQLPGNTDALDTRVVRSILMAGATETVGWDNGQHDGGDGVITTTQSLDNAAGAGLVNLERSAAIYLNPQEAGGSGLSMQGWDLNTVAEGGFVEYSLAVFEDPVELTLSLNWFMNTEFVEAGETSSDLWFSNLDLSLWQLGATATLVAESVSLYNNSEFLRLTLAGGSQYMIQVSHNGMIFDLTGSPLITETYALAWSAEAIPEPATWLLLVGTVLGMLLLRRGRHPVS